MIENAKKRSPTISHSAWKLPIPSPMRSNQPSVRRESRENSLRFSDICQSRLRASHEGGYGVEEKRGERQCRHTGFTPQPSQRAGSRRDGQRWSMPMWQRAKSYLTGSVGSKRERARVISSVVVQERSARDVKPRFRDSLWMWVSTGQRRTLGF